MPRTPCATCGVPLEEGSTVCLHCGRRTERPVRTTPLYQRGRGGGRSWTADTLLLVGSFGLILGLLALALVPLLRRTPADPPPVAEAAPAVLPLPPPAPVDKTPAVPPPVPEPHHEAGADPEPMPSPEPLPGEPAPVVEEPPAADASLEDLLQGYALGRDLYWDALVEVVRRRIKAEAEEYYPLVKAGEELDLRRAGGQVARGAFQGFREDAVYLASAGGALRIEAWELAFGDRVRLDPGYREDVIDALAADYLFQRLPDHCRAEVPAPGASPEDLAAAALRGNVRAARRIGLGHLSNVGQDPDPGRAYAWLTPAAKWGDAEAQFRLGTLYYRGTGVARDESLALAWLSRAAGQGHEPARHFVAAHWQREAAYRRTEEEAAAALERQMRQEAAWLEEAARRPPVTLFRRTTEGVTVGSGAGVTPDRGR